MALSAPVRPRHVLVVARWYPSHDVPARGTFVADLVAALVDQGLRVSVASFETVQPATADPVAVESLAAVEAAWAAAVRRPEALSRPRSWGVAGVPVARLPAVRTWVRGERIDVAEQAARHAGPLLAFGRALADRDPFDLIHAHTGLPDGLASAELADALRLPLLVTEHDSTLLRRLDQDPVALSHYRRLLGGRRRVVAVSEALATGLGARLDLEAPPDVLPNALPTGIFRPGPRQARDPDELLWVGARVSHKGTDRLLRAFALARRERPGLRLRAIGPSPGGDESWLALAEELGVRDAVSFEPAADRQAVAAAMRRAGLLVHPSPAETFGMVAAEALASGLPVAATPSGGVEGIIGRDGRAGELAAGMAPEALAQAILRALARRPSFDPQDLHDRVAQAFGPQVVATRVMAAYDALLEAGSLEAGRAAPPSLRASTPGSAPASPRPTTSTTKSGDRERVLIVARGASAAQRLARLPAVVGPAVSIL
ncbi:MAG TPA: glycosyltransferase, partial [Candidatus Limnocylindrales bacterium]|nr:glycosyltransferase [Candidatus Limnocylindrales bacterium]